MLAFAEARGAPELDKLLAQLESGTLAPDLLALEAVVNGQLRGDVLVRDSPEGLAIDDNALKRWGVRIPPGAVIEFEGRRYVPVAALRGASATIQSRTQRLVVTLPAELFSPSAVQLNGPAANFPPPPSWSAFGNYDLFGYASRGSTYGSGLFEIGAGGPYGAGIASLVSNSSQVDGSKVPRTVFLDTSWRYDDPAAARTIVVGDAINPPGAWGRSLRFTGVQVGTNFTLQPDLITYPLQGFAGTAVVPSTVDVFVNGSRVGTQQVQPGPFTINDVPVVTGSGDVQLVVRDAFGQQRVITQAFYASRQLLAPGLDDYSIGLGKERRDYGLRSFAYQGLFGAGYWRRGLNDSATVEIDASGDEQARAAGGSLDFMAASYGIVTLGGAASDGDAGSGYLALAGYQYQAPRLNVALRSTWASRAFRQPGDDPLRALQRTSFANVGYNLGAGGTIGAAWVDQRYRGEPSTSTAAVTYSANLSTRSFVSVSVSHTSGASPQTALYASVSFSLDAATSASVDMTTTRADGHRSTVAAVNVQRSLPVGEGWGYRVRATSDEQYQAGVIRAGPFGRYALDVASARGEAAARAEISGGIGTLGGVVFAARPIVDSFGIVRVDGVPDVRVYQNGNPVGSTDRDGVVVLTQLYPYIRNRITIDDTALPINIALSARDQYAAPYYRSGVIVDFGAHKLVNAIVAVRLPDGSPLPTGAEVRAAGDERTYPVGLDGEVFITGLVYGATYAIEWSGGKCSFAVDATQATTEPLPRIGPVACLTGTRP